MPELPDVEIFRRRLQRHGLERRIAEVAVNDARILDGVSRKRFRDSLAGARLTSTRRHGKHLLAAIDKGGWLTLHFGMTGALVPFDDMDDEPDYDRIRFDFADGGHLAYTSLRMLGKVGLAEDADAFIEKEKLGPDALAPDFDLAAFEAAVEGRRTNVKSVLMDQSAVAGIGNIYADEILFKAGLHPKSRIDKLSKKALRALYRQTRKVLETAIDRGAGSEQFLERLPRSYLLPQRAKDGDCPRCHAPLRTTRVGGRTTYFCPECQGKPVT